SEAVPRPWWRQYHRPTAVRAPGDGFALAVAEAAHGLDLGERLFVGARHGWRPEQIEDVLAVQLVLPFERLRRGQRGERHEQGDGDDGGEFHGRPGLLLRSASLIVVAVNAGRRFRATSALFASKVCVNL